MSLDSVLWLRDPLAPPLGLDGPSLTKCMEKVLVGSKDEEIHLASLGLHIY